jgi:PAS domain S-box-containing protein
VTPENPATPAPGDARDEPYRLLFERNPNPMFVFDVTTLRFLAVNEAATRKYGYTRDEFLSMSIIALHPPGDASVYGPLDMAAPEPITTSAVHVTKQGVLMNVDIESQLLDFAGIRARLALALDATDRMRAEASALAGAQRYRDLFEHVPVGLYLSTPEGVCVDANPAFYRLLGYETRDALLAVDPDSLYVDPDESRRWRDEVARAGSINDVEVQLRRADGDTVWVRHTASAHVNAEGQVLYYEGAITDITERKKLESEKALRGAILEAQTEASLDAILVVDFLGRIVAYNSQFVEMWRIPPEVIKLGSDRGALEAAQLQVRDVESFRRRIEYLYSHPAERSREEIRMADGRCIDRYSAPIDADGGGYYGRVWYFRDVTEHKQLELQLMQASKMEAVGQLAGGVAHDFNNILTAIQGQALLVLDEANVSSSVRQDVREIEVNARRAAELTRQLLAFSRQQILQSRVLDLAAVVDGIFPMLRRLIASHVSVSCEAAPGLWNVHADPTQIERVILNLAVNAEQAMPGGGSLTVRLDNEVLDAVQGDGLGYQVTPGPYVRLSVTDTGAGMDAEVKARIFEPFFTTKLQGQGTGLGLATVYGIVKQSGGYIWVDSEPGAGATFRVYLPAVNEKLAEITERPSPGVNRGTGRGETIMVCEDEAPVRTLVQRVLEKNGYNVLCAADPREALLIAKTYSDTIHLLLTDIVMPGMGGRELSRLIRAVRPTIKTVLMSGYSDSDLVWADEAGTVTPFLQKPFTPATLAGTISAALDTTRDLSAGENVT